MTGITFAPIIPGAFLIILALIAVALIAYGIWYRARGVLLRAVPVAALLSVLANPQLIHENRTSLKDVAVIVVDDSPSQNLGKRRERTNTALAKLTSDLGAIDDLEVRTVHAGSSTQGGTHLFEALGNALSDVPQQRLAGSILLSDGEVHDAVAPDRAKQNHAAYMNAPVHLLVTGERREFDRRVRIENAPEFGIVGQTAIVRMRAEDTSAAAGTLIPVVIKRSGGKTLQIDMPVGKSTEVPLEIDNNGANIFELSVTPAQGEISTTNNKALLTVNGIRDRLRVLLISGQPHVGERAWRNLLKSDPNVDLVHFTILRPLNKDDGTPVTELALIAFPMRELFEEQLKKFDLIIFDRYSQKGLVPLQYMNNVAQYVRQGGAVMLAVGPEYADSFALFGSPLQSILPAEPTGRIYNGTFRPHISDIGQRHPVTSGLEGAVNGPGGEPTWGRLMRQIQVRARSDATSEPVLSGQEKEPLLVLNHAGQGRVALLLSDTIWLWGKGFDGGGPQTELLRRVAHWLMKEPELEEEAITAQMRDGGLVVTRHSLAPTEQPVTVTAPNGSVHTVTPKATAAGAFEGRIDDINDPGLYTLTDGKITGVAAVGAANPLETYDVVATEDKVGPIAAATGGGTYWLEDMDAPAIRRTEAGRVAHGTTWLGLKANKQYAVTGATQVPLTPVALVLLAIMAGAMLAWWREGK